MKQPGPQLACHSYRHNTSLTVLTLHLCYLDRRNLILNWMTEVPPLSPLARMLMSNQTGKGMRAATEHNWIGSALLDAMVALLDGGGR